MGFFTSLKRSVHAPPPEARSALVGVFVAAPGRLGSPTAMSRAPLNAKVRLCNPTRSSCMDLQALASSLAKALQGKSPGER